MTRIKQGFQHPLSFIRTFVMYLRLMIASLSLKELYAQLEKAGKQQQFLWSDKIAFLINISTYIPCSAISQHQICKLFAILYKIATLWMALTNSWSNCLFSQDVWCSLLFFSIALFPQGSATRNTYPISLVIIVVAEILRAIQFFLFFLYWFFIHHLIY